MIAAYKQLKKELNSELLNILNYWTSNTIDSEYGGFVGRIDHHNKIIPLASKGIILNTRILWSFSAASNYLNTSEYEEVCNRAYQYLILHFRDSEYKGVFWEVDYLGRATNKRKQVYAQAFTIYALCEYYTLSKNEEAKSWAIELYEKLETFSKDRVHGGYLEAFDEDWSHIEDMRLSNKDMNASKTMNTHLHILEAYTSLLKICGKKEIRESLKSLVELFLNKFLNKENHYDLFFDENWKKLSKTVSFGHDIESAWLLIEATKTIGDQNLFLATKKAAIEVTDTFIKEAIDTDGAVINEYNIEANHKDTDRHWWPQVEALIGLNFAFYFTNDPKYIAHSLGIWSFTKKHLIDHENGEWFFRVDANGEPYTQEDKVSMWKAPYHTSRACIKLNNP